MKNKEAFDWIVWQLADSSLPIGGKLDFDKGFISSSGLEAAYKCLELNDVDSLFKFIKHSLHNIAFSTIPYIAKVYSMELTNQSIDSFLNLDQERIEKQLRENFVRWEYYP